MTSSLESRKQIRHWYFRLRDGMITWGSVASCSSLTSSREPTMDEMRVWCKNTAEISILLYIPHVCNNNEGMYKKQGTSTAIQDDGHFSLSSSSAQCEICFDFFSVFSAKNMDFLELGRVFLLGKLKSSCGIVVLAMSCILKLGKKAKEYIHKYIYSRYILSSSSVWMCSGG